MGCLFGILNFLPLWNILSQGEINYTYIIEDFIFLIFCLLVFLMKVYCFGCVWCACFRLFRHFWWLCFVPIYSLVPQGTRVTEMFLNMYKGIGSAKERFTFVLSFDSTKKNLLMVPLRYTNYLDPYRSHFFILKSIFSEVKWTPSGIIFVWCGYVSGLWCVTEMIVDLRLY